MQLVSRIQDLCDSRDTTLIGLEREIGLSRGAIRRWDENSPSVDKLQKVAEYFKVSTDYLLYGFDMGAFDKYVDLIFKGMDEAEIREMTGFTEQEYVIYYMIGPVTRPPYEIVEKIMKANTNKQLVSDASLLKSAGYEDRIDFSVKESFELKTFAAHHDGDDWTEEELEEIEKFKEFIKMKRMKP